MDEQNQDDQYNLFHIKNGRGEPACRDDGRFFGYVDHELKDHPGLEMTPEEYHDQQREELRPSAFARLHLNEPASSEEGFVTREEWNNCFDPSVKLLTAKDFRRVVLGVDASIKHDYTAMVGVRYDLKSQTYQVVFCKVWKPQKSEFNEGKPAVDLSMTVKAEILRLHKRGQVEAVAYDPYQFNSIAIDLRRLGVRMIEFPQTSRRIESDQGLYAAIRSRELRHSNPPDLTEHVLNAVTDISIRGFRLTKEKSYKKIDAAVALSMALHWMREHPAGNYIDYVKGELSKKFSQEEPSVEELKKRFDKKNRDDLDDFLRGPD